MRDKRFLHPRKLKQLAEAYCMGTLATPEAVAFEEHYITCRRCAAILESTDCYIRAMQAAAAELRCADIVKSAGA